MKRQIIIKGLLSLLVVACSDSSYQTQAVRDRVRIVGLEVQDDGLYRFKLCRIHREYTPQILAKECINPLVTADGQEKVFTTIPRKPSTAMANVRNWGLASFVGITAGVVVYKLGRWGVKIRKTPQLVGKAMTEKLDNNIKRVLEAKSGSETEQEFLRKVLNDTELHQRLSSNRINNHQEIQRLMEAEELIQKRLAELGDQRAQRAIDELTISKESAEKELSELESRLGELPTDNLNEKQLKEKQELLINIDKVTESLNSTRFKKVNELTKEELKERVVLWKTKYNNEFDSRLNEVKEAIGKPSVADKASKEDEEIKIEMKKHQRFYHKFLDKIDGGFRGFAKKFKGFPYLSSDSIDYPKTAVVDHDEIVKKIIDGQSIKGITIESGAPKIAGQLTGFSAFIALPLTAISRYLPGHSLLTVGDNWSAITSGLDSKYSTSVRVEDIATILDGIAQATGCKVSNRARTFAL